MIHLDTNYRIGLLVRGSREAQDVERWLAAGEPLAASAVVWSEFLNGPVIPLEVTRAESVIQSRIVPFGKDEAAIAADLFNRTGRRRGSRFDCLIAATALAAQAALATVNQADFKPFLAYGLNLTTPPL
jgi:predicted nucleic acid-binding protein